MKMWVFITKVLFKLKKELPKNLHMALKTLISHIFH